MALDNSGAGNTTHMKDEVIEWVLEKYPSLNKLNDSSINELKYVIDEIEQNKLDKDILHNLSLIHI